MTMPRLVHMTAAGVAVFAFALYAATAYPTIAWWESGELAAAAAVMGIPHEPGSVLTVMAARVASLLPFCGDIARCANLLTALCSAATVFLACLITADILLSLMKLRKDGPAKRTAVAGGAALGGLTLACSDTFWGSALAVNVHAFETFLTGLVVYFGLRSLRAESARFPRHLLVIPFLLGLSTAVSVSAVFLVFPLAFLIAAKTCRGIPAGLTLFVLTSVLLYAVVSSFLPDVVPSLAGMFFGGYPTGTALLLTASAGLAVAVVAGYALAYVTGRAEPLFGFLCGACILAGFSVNAVIPVRAAQDPPINHGDARTPGAFAAFFGKAQTAFFPRGGNGVDGAAREERGWGNATGMNEATLQERFSDGYVRYLLWNFAGRAGDEPRSKACVFPTVDGKEEHADRAGVYPKTYWAIPLFLSLAGMFLHLKSELACGLFLLISFLASGAVPALAGLPTTPLFREESARFMGSYLVLAAWAGVAAGKALLAAAGRPVRPARSALLLLVLLAVVPGKLLHANLPDHDRSADYSARDAAYNFLQSCAEGAILFTNGDNDTYPLLYLQEAEGIRRDIRVVNLGLLSAPWYTLQAVAPGRAGAPVETSFTAEELRDFPSMPPAAIRKTGWLTDRRPIRIPVQAGTMREFLRTSFEGVSRRTADSLAAVHGKRNMVYYARASWPVALDSAGEEVRYYRPWRDVFLHDIVACAAWHRPVSCTPACLEGGFDGLADFVRLEGAAFRLTPIRSPGNGAVARSALRETLLGERRTPVRGPCRGLLLTLPTRGAAFLTREASDMLRWYRSMHLRLAEYEIRMTKDLEAARAVLAHMERAIPSTRYPPDARTAYDMAVFFHEAGDGEAARRLFSFAERGFLREIASHPRDAGRIESPYRYLLDLYLFQHRLPEALALLRRLEDLYPRAADVRRMRDSLSATPLAPLSSISHNHRGPS